MATSRVGDELVAFAAEVRGLPRALMLDAVKAVKRIADAEAARDTGGDGRVSGMRNAKLTLRDDLSVGSDQTMVDIRGGRATGVWRLVSYGAAAHTIRPKRGRRGGGKKALALGNDQFATSVNHPGTRGKGTWDRVVARVAGELPDEMDKKVADIVGRF